MIQAVSTERLFSLASFEGLRLYRHYSSKHPGLESIELISLIESVDADGTSLDLEASSYLDTLVESDCPLDGQNFYQVCIKTVLVKHQPLWAKSMRQGRKRFVSTLDDNDQDIFFAAGLMEDPPIASVVRWWDDVAGHARLITDIEKMNQGRDAELLSINFECKRLVGLGIKQQPVWMGLDDNYAGYDVLTYDGDQNSFTNKMIEVKSTIASPLRFYISRGEWKKAISVGEAYIFHVWDMAKNPPILHVRTVDEISPHIPKDKKSGKWTVAEIPIGI